MIGALIVVLTTGESAQLLHGRLVHESAETDPRKSRSAPPATPSSRHTAAGGSGMPSSTPPRAAPRTKIQVTATGGKLEKRVDTPVQLGATAIAPISGFHSGDGPPTSLAPSFAGRPVRYTVTGASADSIDDERQDHGQHLEVAER